MKRSAVFRWLKVLFALAALQWVGPTAASAAELVLIEHNRCQACIRFNATVGRKYAQTEQGREAPLRRVRLDRGPVPRDLAKITIRGTPTFILMDKGREIGRFDGFRSQQKFWAKLDRLLLKDR